MTTFSDELRGSEGERCTVTDRDGRRYFGTIVTWDDDAKEAEVRYDRGQRFERFSYTDVELLGTETP